MATAAGAACMMSTEDKCTLGGGAFEGDGTTCATAQCVPPPTGACCTAASVGSVGCLVETAMRCSARNGTYEGDGTTCEAGTCAP
jgi:hypothetical protein